MMYSGDEFYGDDVTSGQFADNTSGGFISKEAFELKCPECGSEVRMIGDYDNREFAGYECLMDDSHDTSGLVVKS